MDSYKRGHLVSRPAMEVSVKKLLMLAIVAYGAYYVGAHKDEFRNRLDMILATTAENSQVRAEQAN